MTSKDDRAASGSRIAFDAFDLADESRREAVFALGNGTLTVRGAAPDARSGIRRYPGTYYAGLYNRLASSIAGETVTSKSLVKLPNWVPLRFRIEGEADWFSLEAADLLSYCHTFDLSEVATVRDFTFRDAQGHRTRITEKRFVSMDQPNLAALRFAIEPEGWSDEIMVCSAIEGDVINANVRAFRPYNNRHIVVEAVEDAVGGRLQLEARTEPGQARLTIVTRTRPSLPAR